MVLGAFLVHHSLIVFQLDRWVGILVNGLLLIMACGFVAVHVFVDKGAGGEQQGYLPVAHQDDAGMDRQLAQPV